MPLNSWYPIHKLIVSRRQRQQLKTISPALVLVLICVWSVTGKVINAASIQKMCKEKVKSEICGDW